MLWKQGQLVNGPIEVHLEEEPEHLLELNMSLLLFYDGMDCLPHLSKLLLLLNKRADVVFSLNIVHCRRQGHKWYDSVGLKGPLPATDREQEDSHAVVNGCWTPQVLVGQHVEEFYPIGTLFLFLLHVLELRLLLKCEFKSEELFSLVEQGFIYTFAIDYVLHCDGLAFNLSVRLYLLKLPPVHYNY